MSDSQAVYEKPAVVEMDIHPAACRRHAQAQLCRESAQAAGRQAPGRTAP
jgi:hypothetical protein